MVPLFHACLAEDPRVCGFVHGVFDVDEERQSVEKDGLHYRCKLREGKFFIVNALAFSVPIGNDLSAVPDLVG